MARIPATVITGFLGAGKTSLVRHMIETITDKRIALIINEFGDVGVDGDILRGCGDAACKKRILLSSPTAAYAVLLQMILCRPLKRCWIAPTRLSTLSLKQAG